MKVFISWSGDSKGVAQAIHDGLKSVFDSAEPWISTENKAGAMWLPEIDSSLSDTDFGIICVSKSNQHAPWLNFEAGALSRKVAGKRELMPVLLVDFEETGEVSGPVTSFQMKFATQEGFLTVMEALNSSELGPKISPTILAERVGHLWPAIEIEVAKVKAGIESKNVAGRSDSDKIDELLEVVRGLAEGQPVSKKPFPVVVQRRFDRIVADIVSNDFYAKNPQVSWSEGSDIITISTQGSLSPLSRNQILGHLNDPALDGFRFRFVDIDHDFLSPKDQLTEDEYVAQKDIDAYEATDRYDDKMNDSE
ncbi:hypothetical protein B5P43_18245 [Bacillus sp. SRB_336]|nr:hypothetical protein B5P43_18245 [Bacillus sp. SRB_336]